MHSYKELAVSNGVSPGNVFELKPGDNISIRNSKAQKGKRIKVKQVLVEGSDTGGVGNIILGDRRTLSKSGIVVAILQVDKKTGFLVGKPRISSRGFIFGNKKIKILSMAENSLDNQLQKMKDAKIRKIKDETTSFLENLFFSKTGRRPMVLPIVIES